MGSSRGAGAWLSAAVAATAALFAAPFAYLVARSAADGGAALAAVTTPEARSALANTIVLGVAVAVSATAVGTAAAWMCARTDVPGRRLLRALLPLPLVLPSFIGAFVMLAAFAPGGLLAAVLEPAGIRIGDVGGFWGSFAVLTLLTYPYVYLPAVVRFGQLPPTLEEAARLSGMGAARAFAAVVLPQARAAILAGTLLVFLYAISEFGVVQLMRYPTVTRIVYSTRLFDTPTSLALSLLLGVIAVAVIAAERAVARRSPLVRGASGGPPLLVSLGRWRAAAAGFLGALVGVALVVPVGVLVWWTVRGGSGLRAFGGGLEQLGAAALNTSAISVVAALCAVVAVLPAAWLTVRSPTRLGEAAGAVVVGGFALPGLALALALVFWTVRAPGPIGALYQTLPLLVLAYVVHFGAHSMRAAQVAVAAVPVRVDEAARTLGAGRVRRLVAVELPLMAPGLLAGGGLVLLSVAKELPATLLLSPPGFETLATRIWSATESALFADAALAALALVALSGILTWALVIRRSESLV